MAQAIVRGLIRAGVEDFVVSPGSRSAPLTYAIGALAQAGRVRAHVRIDERDAAFTALGLARAGRLAGRERPVAIVTTSGSAVGNLHPAVMEAAHSHVPLIVLSADRPARLRGTGANQTLDAQHRSLPEAVAAWDVHVPGPARTREFPDADGVVRFTAVTGGPELSARAAEQLAAQAVRTAWGERRAPGCGAGDHAWREKAAEMGADHCGSGGLRLDDALPGPVQINVQFDVPLVPEAADLDPAVILDGDDCDAGGSEAAHRTGEAATAHGVGEADAGGAGGVSEACALAEPTDADGGEPPRPADRTALLTRIRTALLAPETRAVLVAGDDLGFASPTAAALAGEFVLPVFAEPSSALASLPQVVPAHARVLAAPGTAALREEITHVLVAGRPTLSRPVAALLDREDVERIDLPYAVDGIGAPAASGRGTSESSGDDAHTPARTGELIGSDVPAAPAVISAAAAPAAPASAPAAPAAVAPNLVASAAAASAVSDASVASDVSGAGDLEMTASAAAERCNEWWEGWRQAAEACLGEAVPATSTPEAGLSAAGRQCTGQHTRTEQPRTEGRPRTEHTVGQPCVERAAAQPALDSPALDGAAAARAVLERPGVVFAASSNTIRLLAAEQRPQHPARVLASRGLAGIDGLIATASGLALGLEDEAACGPDEAGAGESAPCCGGSGPRPGESTPPQSERVPHGSTPVRLLVGDLAALHDLGGFLIPAHERRPHLQIVVLNDDGGAIFSGLEHSAEHLRPYFDRFFATPHGYRLAEAARSLGWEAQTVESGAPGAAAALAAFLDSGEPGLLEVRLP
nr:thiamine pyrophosphate-binding protein [Brevibacterium sp.]